MPMVPRDRTSQSACRSRSRAAGFTIVELLVVMVISSILAMSVVAVFVNQTRAMALNEDLVDLQQNLRVAMDMLHRDVRMGGLNAAGNFPPFGVGALDCDGDGVVGDCRSDGIAGGPHALAVRYAEEPGMKILGEIGANAVFCSVGNLEVPGGLGEKVFISFAKPPGFVDFETANSFMSTGVGCGGVSCPATVANPLGKCDNITFPSGVVKNGGAIPADPVGGFFWGKMNYTIYSISQDYDCDGTDDGPAALTRVNNYEGCGVVAFGVNDFEVTYILEDGTETFVIADLDTLAEQATIRKVRLNITGETRNDHNIGGSSGKRTRTMTTEVLVRNLTF